MTTAILLPGSSPAPRGVVMPSPAGVVGYYEFFGPDWTTSRRNLRNPTLPLGVVGSPGIGAGYGAFPGVGDYASTGFTETLVMAGLAIVRVPAGLTSSYARILGNFTSRGVVWMFSESFGMAVYSNINDGSGGITQSNGGNFPQTDVTRWNVVSFVLSATGRRLRNLTDGTAANTTLTNGRVVGNPTTAFRIGTNGLNAPQPPQPIDIASLMLWRDVEPSDADLDANAALMRTRALASGLTVSLA